MIRPPPMPVPRVMSVMWSSPRPAPNLASPQAVALASFSTITGSPTWLSTFFLIGSSRQARLGANSTVDRLSSTKPAAPRPTASTSSYLPLRMSTTSAMTAAVSCGLVDGVGRRSFSTIRPRSSTTPAATFVAPTSTPMVRVIDAGPLVAVRPAAVGRFVARLLTRRTRPLEPRDRLAYRGVEGFAGRHHVAHDVGTGGAGRRDRPADRAVAALRRAGRDVLAPGVTRRLTPHVAGAGGGAAHPLTQHLGEAYGLKQRRCWLFTHGVIIYLIVRRETVPTRKACLAHDVGSAGTVYASTRRLRPLRAVSIIRFSALRRNMPIIGIRTSTASSLVTSVLPSAGTRRYAPVMPVSIVPASARFQC